MSKGPPLPGHVTVALRLTTGELGLLEEFCEEDFRSLASWFRRAVHRGWQARETRKRKPSGTWRRRVSEQGDQTVAVYARLTPEERRRLDLLCDDDNVAPSEWFCRVLVDELGEPPTVRRRMAAPAPTRSARSRA